jgi:hypothetical protein
MQMCRVVVVACLAGVLGCGRVTVVQRSRYGGVLELDGDRQKAVDLANGEMSSQCGASNYTVTSEGYQPSRAPRARNAGPPPMVWTIEFQCNQLVGPRPDTPAPGYPQPYPQEPGAAPPYAPDPGTPPPVYQDPNAAPPPPPPATGPY